MAWPRTPASPSADDSMLAGLRAALHLRRGQLATHVLVRGTCAAACTTGGWHHTGYCHTPLTPFTTAARMCLGPGALQPSVRRFEATSGGGTAAVRCHAPAQRLRSPLFFVRSRHPARGLARLGAKPLEAAAPQLGARQAAASTLAFRCELQGQVQLTKRQTAGGITVVALFVQVKPAL